MSACATLSPTSPAQGVDLFVREGGPGFTVQVDFPTTASPRADVKRLADFCVRRSIGVDQEP